jgi:hypothetical protein
VELPPAEIGHHGGAADSSADLAEIDLKFLRRPDGLLGGFLIVRKANLALPSLSGHPI